MTKAVFCQCCYISWIQHFRTRQCHSSLPHLLPFLLFLSFPRVFSSLFSPPNRGKKPKPSSVHQSWQHHSNHYRPLISTAGKYFMNFCSLPDPHLLPVTPSWGFLLSRTDSADPEAADDVTCSLWRVPRAGEGDMRSRWVCGGAGWQMVPADSSCRGLSACGFSF